MGYAPDPIATREQCLRLLLATLPVIGKWSERLSEGDPDRQHALRRYFLALVGLEIGILREIRRGWLAGGQVILVVDEPAEHRRPVRRPRLSVRHERPFAATCSGSSAASRSVLPRWTNTSERVEKACVEHP